MPPHFVFAAALESQSYFSLLKEQNWDSWAFVMYFQKQRS